MASSPMTKFGHLQIPLEDVVQATNNFHDNNIIGRGGFGPIYKGGLMRSGTVVKVAVLRLDRKQGQQDIEFWTEISMLSNLQHTNLVSIVGFCNEKDEKIIITTYSAKGSLSGHLNNPKLTWTQRLKICVGVARALRYLHYDEERGYGVIHLNINSSTILLDENWEPKLSGFKVSVKHPLNRMDQVFLSEPIGTIGYVDPEIEKTKGVTQKSDIYSFGVVLFELLCGRRAYLENEANVFLARVAKYHYENETMRDIIHPSLRNQMSPHSLRIYLKTAYSCLEKERAGRPHIHIIVDKLEKALQKALKFQPDFGKNLENLKIQLNDIKLATHNFSDTYKIGSNDYYTWYKVELDHFDREKPSSVEGMSKSELPTRHNTVIIKRFLPVYDEQEEEIFFNELIMLTSVKHRNIVSLIGFCVEGSEMMLVTENFSNGHLMHYLSNVKDVRILTWEKRLKICIDVAEALKYLHFEMEDRKMIIHSNINDTKIGFNENWEAKIEDFEWAVFLPPNQKDEVVYEKIKMKSTYHVDPDYTKTGKLKRESDVYSFGVVLFEILCGRHAYDQIYLKNSVKGLVHVARENFSKGGVEDMIDPTLKVETSEKSSFTKRGANEDSLNTVLKVANQCVAEIEDERPTMKVVLEELKKALFIEFSVEKTNLLRLQQPNNYQVVKELEEERVQKPHKDQVVDGLEIVSQKILGNNLEHLKIPLSDIKRVTGNFAEGYKIASWDDINFYTPGSDHLGTAKISSDVVIKRYPFEHEHYGEKQFFTEIELLSSNKHLNTVTLLGFCVEDSEMILVIDNVSNGYLGNYLRKVNNMRILSWEKRLKICIDVAHTLKYRHYPDQMGMRNHDITSYNIGLGDNLGAKIVDFWLSVFRPVNEEPVAEYFQWLSTPYFLDEYFDKVDEYKRESDVYRFGEVLFEFLCGRTLDDPIYKKESDAGLASVARQCYRSGTLHDIIDPMIMGETGENNFVLNRGPNKDSLHTFIEVAYGCVAEIQDQRPTMEVVVKELEKALICQKNNKDNPRISLEDIKVATRNFHSDNCIGGGGFGRVFKGNLQDGDGFKIIAAKRLDTRLGQGEQQFLTELQILLEYKHDNVIGLIGYCDEKDEKMIVYEYAPKESLDRYLKDASLTWVKRLNICVDVASALDFIHGGVGKKAKVIHRDIKTANILLNDDWKAKLGDFGLSLISPITQETEYVIDHVCGTPGYVDPLYRRSGFLTIESDIYSFGVVLFEILCGKSTFAIHKHEGCCLPNFIKNRFEEGKLDEVVFELIREQIEPKSLTTFQKIAYQCLHDEREKRPTTKDVLTELKNALEFQISRGDASSLQPQQVLRVKSKTKSQPCP